MLSEISIEKYFESINKLMTEGKLYQKPVLKLKDIAEELKLPEYLISQIINQKSGLTFRNYLNTFRVQKAKEMLLVSYEQYSIEGIAKEVGFNSRASFYNAFKKLTSLTPSEFLSKNKRVV